MKKMREGLRKENLQALLLTAIQEAPLQLLPLLPLPLLLLLLLPLVVLRDPPSAWRRGETPPPSRHACQRPCTLCAPPELHLR